MENHGDFMPAMDSIDLLLVRHKKYTTLSGR